MSILSAEIHFYFMRVFFQVGHGDGSKLQTYMMNPGDQARNNPVCRQLRRAVKLPRVYVRIKLAIAAEEVRTIQAYVLATVVLSTQACALL